MAVLTTAPPEALAVTASRIGMPSFERIPSHIGVIPDGNRRWAEARGLPKAAGYGFGIEPGFRLYELCVALGVPELTLYGFTQDNTKRPGDQKEAFRRACVDAVQTLAARDAALLVVGDFESPLFPRDLLPFTRERIVFGKGSIRVNFLVNYGWRWDIAHALRSAVNGPGNIEKNVASAGISRLDLIIRWGGRRRLSGFLPFQSIYADFYVVDALWPDFEPEHLYQALRWYQEQDITLGG